MNTNEPNAEDEMMDALLREQSCDRREQSIQDVEDAIMNDAITHVTQQPSVDWKRMLISGSIAATLVLGFGFTLSMFLLPPKRGEVEHFVVSYAYQEEPPSPGQPGRRAPKETVQKRPSAPSVSTSRVIVSSATGDGVVPTPPKLGFGAPGDFGSGWGGYSDYGAGWGSGSGGGGGGAGFHARMPMMGGIGREPLEHTNNERYGELVDQEWRSPLQKPLSTFSVDVDNASYSNIRRLIRDGRPIPKDAVRIEECINAFDYGYKAPTDDRAFAVHTDLLTCPWNERHMLVKVGIKGREMAVRGRPASNLVFLIDVSGSMQSREKLPLVKESLKLLLHQLDGRDSVSFVVYAGSEGLVLPPTRIDEAGRAKAIRALDRLEAGGSTNGGAGIKLAYRMASANYIKGGVNRVILASDGDFNVGITDNKSLVDLVKERAANNVYLSALAFGTGNLNDAMFEAISNEGNGNYFYIDGAREGRKVFLHKLTSTLVTIAKDVKLQIEFNPQRVASYRLIGYSNRVLKKEDFDNDRVDAGDIGAGHTVTAFYEIVPAGQVGPKPVAEDGLKYQKRRDQWVEAGPDDEWLTLKLRHKHPEGDVSSLQESVLKGRATSWREAGIDTRFATGVALFGMKLRGMEEVAGTSWDQVLRLTQPGLRNDPQEDRAEFIAMVRQLMSRNR